MTPRHHTTTYTSGRERMSIRRAALHRRLPSSSPLSTVQRDSRSSKKSALLGQEHSGGATNIDHSIDSSMQLPREYFASALPFSQKQALLFQRVLQEIHKPCPLGACNTQNGIPLPIPWRPSFVLLDSSSTSCRLPRSCDAPSSPPKSPCQQVILQEAPGAFHHCPLFLFKTTTQNLGSTISGASSLPSPYGPQ